MKFSWKSIIQVPVSVLGSLFLFSFALATTSGVQWSQNGVTVSNVTGGQSVENSVLDGDGGVIVSWIDTRNGINNKALYVQRFDENGSAKWTNNGLKVADIESTSSIDKTYMVSDNSGGVIIVWNDYAKYEDSSLSYDIYGQHISSSGQKMWGGEANSRGLVADGGGQFVRGLVADNQGGAYLTWVVPKGDSTDIYIQHIGSDGNGTWEIDGKLLATTNNNASIANILADTTNGVFVAWTIQDGTTTVNGSQGPVEIPVWGTYLQHLDISGEKSWGENGTYMGVKFGVDNLVSDDNGGLVSVWKDNESTISVLYAQRVNYSAQKQWGNNGLPVASAGNHNELHVTSSIDGGIIFSWNDANMGVNSSHVYVQKLDGNGYKKWDSSGLLVVDNSHVKTGQKIYNDGLGGVFVVWTDRASNLSQSINVYAQHISVNGQKEWSSSLPVSTLNNSQSWTPTLIAGSNSAFVAWSRVSNISNISGQTDNLSDLFVQKIRYTSFSGNEISQPINNNVEQKNNEQSSNASGCSLDKGKAYRYSGNNVVYFITNDCTKKQFNDAQTFFTYFDSWNSVIVITKSKLDSIQNDKIKVMPKGSKYDPKYGALVKTLNDPKVYLLLNDSKYWITSEKVFEGLNYKWGWIEDVDQSLLNKYVTKTEINDLSKHPNYTLVKYANDPKVYRLEPNVDDSSKQVKRYIPNEKIFAQLNFRFDRVVTIPSTEVYTDGLELK